MTLSDWLNLRIDRSAMPIAEIARAAGLSRATVYSWLSGGRVPSAAARFLLIEILDLSASEAAELRRLCDMAAVE